MLDGVHLLEAYVRRHGGRHVQLFVRDASRGHDEIAGWLGRIPEHLLLADNLFDSLAPVDTPTGLLAIVAMPQVSGDDTLRGCSVLLDGIQDPGNLGAILRSAAAAGAQRAFVSDACVDPWSPRCLRGGMGAHFHLHVHDRVALGDVLNHWTGQLIAADPGGAQALFDTPIEHDAGFIIGAEGRGIAANLLARATHRVRIPMTPGIESLNAAAAATLLLYEWRRQHAGA